jgi:hypothetical protein
MALPYILKCDCIAFTISKRNHLGNLTFDAKPAPYQPRLVAEAADYPTEIDFVPPTQFTVTNDTSEAVEQRFSNWRRYGQTIV